MAHEMRRILLTKRKTTTTSPASQSMPPPPRPDGTSKADRDNHTSHPPAQPNAVSALPHPDFGAPSIRPQTAHPAPVDRVKSESRSPPPQQAMASIAAQREPSVPASSAPTQFAPSSINSLVNSMVDTTAYNRAPRKSPSAPRKSPSAPSGSATTDERLLRKLVADPTAFPFDTAGGRRRDSLQRPDNFSTLDSAFITEPTSKVKGRHTPQDESLAATPMEITALSSDIPPAVIESSRRGSRISSSSPRILNPRSQLSPSQTSNEPKPSNAKPSTPRSLYPGSSATMTPSDQQINISANRRSRLARSEHPERFQYAGNTFSNLDERAFHETAENNPYLHQLTSDATRPVYKTPLEARRALKEAEKASEPVVAPIDYDQLIKELKGTIAEFRKKYEKSKIMTTQAGIQVEDNVWDRLSNIVQYPPDFDAYAQSGQELSKYAEEMKAWDRAIGHQVIIKKRIIYKEAIEKLQVKLDIVQAEKGLDSHNASLKRKADHDAERDEDTIT